MFLLDLSRFPMMGQKGNHEKNTLQGAVMSISLLIQRPRRALWHGGELAIPRVITDTKMPKLSHPGGLWPGLLPRAIADKKLFHSFLPTSSAGKTSVERNLTSNPGTKWEEVYSCRHE